jgi:hypothetical protein
LRYHFAADTRTLHGSWILNVLRFSRRGRFLNLKLEKGHALIGRDGLHRTSGSRLNGVRL